MKFNPSYEKAMLAIVLLMYFCSFSIAHENDALNADSLSNMASLTSASHWNSTMFWGSYRPNLYFGMKTRSPHPFLTGIMWHGVSDYASDGREFEGMRHTCEEGDKMKSYGWHRANGLNFGEQDIVDPAVGIKIKTTFLKKQTDHFGGEWVARISGESLTKTDKKVALYFHFGFDRQQEDEFLELVGRAHKGLNVMQLEGSTKDLGEFSIIVHENEDNKGIEFDINDDENAGVKASHDFSKKILYMGVKQDEETVWQTKSIAQGALRADHKKLVQTWITEKMKDRKPNSRPDHSAPQFVATLPNSVEKDSNLYIFQRMVTTPFEFDIIYHSQSDHHVPTKKAVSAKKKKLSIHDDAIYGQSFSDRVAHLEKQFDQEFERTFKLGAKGFSKEQQEFARNVFSNLIGGIGYFHGNYLVQPKNSQTVYYAGPASLFSAVPSRPFFPRGFLWDEGFHQLLISEWNTDITIDVLRHWFSLMNADGWIPREQILGSEARSKVPSEFQVQREEFANPPTLMLVLEKFAQGLAAQGASPYDAETSAKISAFLSDVLPFAERWFGWFKKTQFGEIPDTFRWRGRTENHTLTSGLDDYPRSSPPSNGELHVDLLSWVAKGAHWLSIIAKAADKDHKLTDKIKKLEDVHNTLIKRLEEVHWDPLNNVYADFELANNSNSLSNGKHITHIGYISFFPLMLGLIPTNSPKLEATLKSLRDPAHVWSPYGILSLSRSDPYFGTGENYWKGPIWMNMNYMIVASLYKNYVNNPGSEEDNPYRETARQIYTDLRNNLIKNVFENYRRTGFVWEQYNPNDGKGQRSHPFTGWTSLIVAIMSEMY